MSLYNFLFGFDGIIIRDKKESSLGEWECMQSYYFFFLFNNFWGKKENENFKRVCDLL